MDPGPPQPIIQDNTWSQRNPLKPVIAPCKNYAPKKMAAQKASAAAAQEANCNKAVKLNSDIQTAITENKQAIKDIAKKHGRTVNYIQKKVTNRTHYKGCWALNTWNVLVLHKSIKLNEG